MSVLYITYGTTLVEARDPLTLDILASTSLSAGNTAYGITVSPDGTKVFTGFPTLFALDATTLDVLYSATPVTNARVIAVSPSGNRLAIGSAISLVILDASDLSHIYTVATANGGADPTSICWNPAETYIGWAEASGAFQTYSASSYALHATGVSGVESTAACVFSADSTLLYGTDKGALNNFLWEMTAPGLTNPGTSAGLGTTPTSIVISPDGSELFVLDSGSAQISKIATSGLVVTNYSLGGNPSGLAISSDGASIYTSYGTTLGRLNTSGTSQATATIGAPAIAMAFGIQGSPTPPMPPTLNASLSCPPVVSLSF